MNVALAILKNVKAFGHVLVAHSQEDGSLAARCEFCRLFADYPVEMARDVKDTHLRRFIKLHARCEDTEEKAAPKVILA